MNKLISQMIEENEWWNNLPDKYAPLKDYYINCGPLFKIHKFDVYTYQGKEIKIGRMMDTLRSQYKAGVLSEEVIEALDAMDIRWDRLFFVRKYYQEHQTLADIKLTDKYTYNGTTVNIGDSINSLRVMYKQGALKDEMIAELNNMGMRWGTFPRLTVLTAYYKEFNTLAYIKNPDIYVYMGVKIQIGRMIEFIRALRKEGGLTQNEIDALDAMDIRWDRLFFVRKYYQEHQTLADIKCSTNFIFKGKEVKIGVSISNLREDYKKGKLSKDVINELNSMGMVWHKKGEKRIEDSNILTIK